MTNPLFSWNLLTDITFMWQYDFMRHAFEAGTLIAVVAGAVGYFVVLRNSAFASHASAEIGFAGAAGALLFGLNPIVGLFAASAGGAILIAFLGRRAAQRDLEIGTVLAFMLGLGILFMSLYHGYATEAFSLLFGQILGVSSGNVIVTAVAAIVAIVTLAFMYRPLLFASIDEDVAEARGVPIFGLGVAFMLLVAVATSIAVQVVGALLIFSLMVTPAAAAVRIARTPAQGITIAVLIALISTWFGLFIAFYVSYPVSFFITSATFAVYLIVRAWQTSSLSRRASA